MKILQLLNIKNRHILKDPKLFTIILNEEVMKKVFSLVFIVLIICPVYAQQVNWFEGSLDEAIAEAKESGKLILLDFFTGSG